MKQEVILKTYINPSIGYLIIRYLLSFLTKYETNYLLKEKNKKETKYLFNRNIAYIFRTELRISINQNCKSYVHKCS